MSPFAFARSALAAGAVLLAVVPRAGAATLNWANGVSGSAALASNWSPAQVPAAADALVFNTGGFLSYSITFPAAVPASQSFTVRNGSVTFNMTSPHAVSGAFRVGTVAGDGSMPRVIGILSVGASSVVGDVAGVSADMTVTGLNSVFQVTNPGADLVVGNAGPGTLGVLDGALVRVADNLHLGEDAGANGSLRVSGTAGAVPSTFSTESAAGDMQVGLNGSGFLRALDGGHILSKGAIHAGVAPGSFGSILALGSGGTESRITATTGLAVGGNRIAGTPGGEGDLRVNLGGVVRSLATFELGDPDGGGDATLTMVGGFVHTRSLLVDAARGEILFSGGTLRVDAGTMTHAPLSTLRVGSSSTLGDGRLELVRGATGTTARGIELDASDGATARLVLDSGASLAVNGTLTANLGSCSIEVDSSAALVTTGRLVLGTGGTMTIRNGGAVTVNEATVDGRIVVDGGTLAPDSLVLAGNARLEARGTILADIVGNAPNATIEAIGDLDLGDAASPAGYDYQGTLRIGGHFVRLRDSGAITLGDSTTIDGGTLASAGPVVLGTGTRLIGYGTVQAEILNAAGTIEVAGTPFGTLNHTRNSSAGSGSSMTFRVGGSGTGQFDRFVSSGPMFLGGTLRVRFPAGAALEPGVAIPLITVSGRLGTFNAVVFEGFPSPQALTLGYTATQVLLTLQPTVDVPAPLPTVPTVLAFAGGGGPGAATFRLDLPGAADVRVEVFDVSGRRLGMLVDDALPSGSHAFPLSRLAIRPGPGVYFGRATVRLPGVPAARLADRIVVD
jgi:fibronectin-binding autotransporter adhesin